MRIAVGVEYDGSDFNGWQTQLGDFRTVQSALEKALSQVANSPIQVVCAGRTDRGVHALDQVVHFDTDIDRSNRAWLLGGNSNLPRDISLSWAMPVSDEFHARFSAIKRRYRYYIYNHPTRSAVMRSLATWHLQSLDSAGMHEAAQCLVGEHDFSSFRGSDCQAASPVRTIDSISVSREGKLICVEVLANAFLHHMVRNIVGSLMAVGEGKESLGWFQSVLEAKDRKVAGITAPPQGLYLCEVTYPKEFEIPKSPLASPFDWL